VRWEYHILVRGCRSDSTSVRVASEEHAKELNDLGEKGWELVSMIPAPHDGELWSVSYVFKRPKEKTKLL